MGLNFDIRKVGDQLIISNKKSSIIISDDGSIYVATEGELRLGGRSKEKIEDCGISEDARDRVYAALAKKG